MSFPDNLLYAQWPLPLSTYPGWVPKPHIDGFQYAPFPNVHPRHHQMPINYMVKSWHCSGQFPDDTEFGSVASSSAGYAQACLDTPMTPVGMYSQLDFTAL
ncbi:hypothetical protein HETIRDRAFT_326097 [Heterobasidion irregulare TC 32-1]|uniref:Uncharacterized protein n=1 Tax=Heterobasidion irregulare (strain TC 32-1) TaxID=747525 RepID=W4JZS3_HETIT|nr:uncharacterized protein HETIRDRAFT_326097 [Heterobasidion irregulare TC 32-1]ETW78341.1 hypothetical protein HETIRDRAFT_326097 [Heterobasidion irregulare TC 32-1]